MLNRRRPSSNRSIKCNSNFRSQVIADTSLWHPEWFRRSESLCRRRRKGQGWLRQAGHQSKARMRPDRRSQGSGPMGFFSI